MTRDGLSSAFTTTLLVLLLEAVKLLRLNLVFGLVMSGLRPWKVMFEGEMVLLFFWIVAGVNNKVEEAGGLHHSAPANPVWPRFLSGS